VDLRELLSQFRESAAVVANRPGVGEQLLAERLIHQAHDVALEEPSAGEDGDLPGWPARVDGTRVRLLASPDPAEVQRLLDRAPALAIVTVAEHARPFAEQANVLALPDLSYAQMRGETAVGTAEESEPGEDAEPEVGASPSGLGSLLAGQLVSR